MGGESSYIKLERGLPLYQHNRNQRFMVKGPQEKTNLVFFFGTS